MNINGINEYSNNYFTKIQRLKDSQINYETGNFHSIFSAEQNSGKDNLTDKYLNITDSMSRKEKVSFAASIMTNRIMGEETNDENTSFMKNIASGFTSDEIDSLKNEIRTFATIKNTNSSEVENLINMFDGIVSELKQFNNSHKQQIKHDNNNINIAKNLLIFLE